MRTKYIIPTQFISKHCRVLCLLLSTIAVLTACATDGEVVNQPAEVFFRKAMLAIDENDSITAKEQLQMLNNQHPFSPYAPQGLLELAHIHYLTNQYTEAKSAINRFLRLYADSEQADYAYYLRGMIFFEQDRTGLQNYTSINPALRDLTFSQSAYKDFGVLIRNYPDSRFSEDARNHMAYIRYLLAQKEVAIGAFYLKREAWVAAANRGQYILENFVDSPESVAQALDIMVSAYTSMEMPEQANESAQILQVNFPDYQSKYRTQ